MFVTSLDVKSYKNIISENVDFDKNINIFYGNNGQGKTNLLESIYFCLSLKNFRNLKNKDLVTLGNKKCDVIVFVENKYGENKYQISLRDNKKYVYLNGKNPGKSSIWFGNNEILTFIPDDISYLKKSPADRRTLIDRGIFQHDKSFLIDHRNYEKCLKQRNNLLKKDCSWKQVEPWTIQLIDYARKIVAKRIEHVELLNRNVNTIYRKITNSNESIEINYIKNQNDDFTVEYLKNKFYRDLKYGFTLDGPHRDDIEFKINDTLVRSGGSQGQIKLIVLAVKLCQIDIIKNITKRYPLILLDDIAGDLDKNRLEKFFEVLIKEKIQIFITTSNLNHLPANIVSQARCFNIDSGKVISQT